ncbi:MAG TPA: transcription elongation factor GreB [Gammaproteobacteria bacterium]|nr:transcription elongation factor GreB [Gammaproteobacteria bacterium]
MGRYRPPPPPRSNYITPQGAAALKGELDRLWRIERPAVTRAVAEAAAQGDRSENAEYIYGKKQLAAIDRRVRHLRKRLASVQIVDRAPDDAARIYFGAWFELDDEAGRTQLFRLVGPDEFDHRPEYLSMDSPLGRAVRGKGIGEDVVVEAPGGAKRYTVAHVAYGEQGSYDRRKKKARPKPGESQGEL